MLRHVLVVSNAYPTPEHPYYGVFVRRYVDTLRALEPTLRVSLAVMGHDDAHGVRATVKYLRLFIRTAERAWRAKPNVMHVHYAIPTGAVAPFIRALTGVPYVITLHGGDFDITMRQIPGGEALMRWVLRRAARVTVVGKSYVDPVARLAGLDPAAISVINMGVDTKAYHPTQGTASTRCLLFVGRLDEIKGLDVLLGALGALASQDWHLTVVGTGPQREALQTRAEGLGLSDRVQWRGAVRPERMPALYREHGLVVIPSREEPFGLVATEAMATGLPLIASNVGGLAEQIQHGHSGWLVPPGDARALAERIEQVWCSPPEALANIRAEARGAAEAHGIERRTSELLRVLQDVARTA